MWKILRQGGFRNTAIKQRDGQRVPRGGSVLPPLQDGQASVTWIGHATYLVRIGGLAILTDPVWSERLPGRSKRMSPPGIAWERLPLIDAVVISHNHYDHQDRATLKRLPKSTAMFVPGASAPWFRSLGFSNVTELDWWESATYKGVQFDFVPAHHWSRRGLFDACRHLWGGWILSAPGKRVYFAGDTGYGHWFKEIGANYSGIDVALMPIGAYAPRWFMKPVHTDPDEAIQASIDVGARNMGCMHWGTFVLTQEPLMEPLERVRAAWEKLGRPHEQLWDLGVGESRVF
jgi:L-ascorbate metabolism protein UlaG (beta-lactamase superfamily)